MNTKGVLEVYTHSDWIQKLNLKTERKLLLQKLTASLILKNPSFKFVIFLVLFL